jgi:hypothetical protein
MQRKSLYVIVLLLVATASSAAYPSCKMLESDYEKAEQAYEKLIKERGGGKELYTSVNRYIDAATALLAYCRDELTTDRQYSLQSELRKSDRERARYVELAIREFHREYGIRPRVQEYYQHGYYGPGPGKSSKLPPPSRQPLPPVQPQLPPISR